MVLCLHFLKRRIIWIFFLHHRKKRKRIHPIIYLLPGIKTRISFVAFSCILLNINSVLHNFLPDNQTPVWRLCPDRTIGYRAPLLHLLYHVLRFWRSVFIAANQLSKLKHITLHFFVLHVNSGSDERQ
jgi:hypothetical protein